MRWRAREYSAALAKTLPAGVEIRDWTVDHASYFRAIRIEKTMVAIILMLIVAVAAFYLVAMLAMVVTDKRTDIAILRTLGTSPRRVMAIFLIQGSVIAWFGVALGVVFGSLHRLQRRRRGGVPRAAVPLRDLQLRGVHRDAHAVGAARRADPVDRRHRHVHHAARHYLPGASAPRAYRRPTRCATSSMAMNLPYEWLIGTRYLRSAHRSGFVSFVASMSVIGLALGVAVLIVVLSVLNGFERELRSRMLAVTSHATITGVDGDIADWRTSAGRRGARAGSHGGGAVRRIARPARQWRARGRRHGARRPAGRRGEGGGPRRAHDVGGSLADLAGRQVPHHPGQRAGRRARREAGDKRGAHGARGQRHARRIRSRACSASR